MTPQQIEAMKLALDFIEKVNKDGWILADFEPQMYSTIAAIKEALVQPEQEPVAWLDGPHLVVRSDMRDRLNYKGPWVDLGRAIPDKWTPILFTTPPQRTEQNFCSRCGKRTKDIHTCTPPNEGA